MECMHEHAERIWLLPPILSLARQFPSIAWQWIAAMSVKKQVFWLRVHS